MRMRRPPYAINGFFLTQRTTDVQRVAYEIVCALDGICDPGEFVLVVPEDSPVPSLCNVEVCRCGKGSMFFWEQIHLFRYLFQNGRFCINMCQSAPLLGTDFFFMHDCAYKTHPEFFDGLHGLASRLYHMLMFGIAARRQNRIMTVSLSARDEICFEYELPKDKVSVIGCGWEHVDRIETSGLELEEFGLVPGSFFFSLGGGKNKNIDWVLEVARRNPEQQFVIAGKKAASNGSVYRESGNVRFLGYVSDSQVKALMRDCKAFLFPSTYEGFGLPPLEALACGSKVIVSDIPVFRQTYGASAVYIDPFFYDYDIVEIASKCVDSPEAVLEKNTWSKSAERLLSCVRDSLAGEAR